MYLGLFGLNEPPFRITPHTDFFFDGANRGATLEALLYAITNDEGIVKVSGEVGSGKTMLCRVLMERLPKSVETIYLANPSLTREEILYAIADELRVELQGERSARLLKELQDQLISLYSSGKRVVVLIDEAHAMPKETLEEIRLLSNLESGQHKLLQIVLFGQPELNELLSSPDMRQLKERITHSFALEPLVTGDIDNYIDFRMRAAGYRGPKVFSKQAVRMISATSEGLTRRVNILADKALLAAFAAGTHSVTHKEARAAIRDSDFYRPRSSHRRAWLGGATLAAGVVLGAIAGQWLGRGAPITTPASTVRSAAVTQAAPAPLTAPPATAATGAAATANAPAIGATAVPEAATATATAASSTPASARAPATAANTPAAPSVADSATVHAAPSLAPATTSPASASSPTKPAPVANAGPANASTAVVPSATSGQVTKTAQGAEQTSAQTALHASVQTASLSPALAAPTPAAARAAEDVSAAARAQPDGDPSAPSGGKLTTQVFNSTQSWLKSASGSSYSIQLMTVRADETEKIERFFQRASNEIPLSELHLYSVKINGQQHYRVAYGYYPSQRETSQAIKSLPSWLMAEGPFARSVARMRSQNQQ